MQDSPTLWGIALGLLALGAVLSVLLARVEPGHHHAAIGLLLGAGVPSAIVQRVARAHLLAIPPPYEGADRALFHLGQVLFLAWPVGVAAVALRIFARRSAGVLAVASALGAFAICAAYPRIRGDALIPLYRFWWGAAVAVGFGAVVAFGWRRGYPLLEHAISAVLVTGELVVLAGAFSLGIFDAWPAAQMSYVAAFGAVVVLQGRHLWRTRLTSAA